MISPLSLIAPVQPPTDKTTPLPEAAGFAAHLTETPAPLTPAPLLEEGVLTDLSALLEDGTELGPEAPDATLIEVEAAILPSTPLVASLRHVLGEAPIAPPAEPEVQPDLDPEPLLERQTETPTAAPKVEEAPAEEVIALALPVPDAPPPPAPMPTLTPTLSAPPPMAEQPEPLATQTPEVAVSDLPEAAAPPRPQSPIPAAPLPPTMDNVDVEVSSLSDPAEGFAALESSRPTTQTQQAAPLPAPEAPRPTPPLLRNVLDRISEVEVGEGRTRLLLRPQGLGTLEIDLSRLVDGRLHLTIRAENPMVLEALRQDSGALGDFMGARGFDLSGGGPDLDRYTPPDPGGDSAPTEEIAEAEAEATHQPLLSAERLDLVT